MEKRINIAELLKDCPKGMELDCTVWEKLYFEEITNADAFPISCYFEQNGVKIPQYFTKYGCYHSNDNAKCIIFPKDKTTWKGFIPPCKFKDGDIVTCGWNSDSNSFSWTCIVAEPPCKITTDAYLINDYCSLDCNGGFVSCNSAADSATWFRLATEEEKQKLFDAIKANGYKWNAEKKCLEKLKADKFDITTLIPFESKVLMREDDNDCWRPAWYGYKNDINKRFYAISAGSFRQCIPYAGNEHLLGTTEDCDSYFKTWEELS